MIASQDQPITAQYIEMQKSDKQKSQELLDQNTSSSIKKEHLATGRTDFVYDLIITVGTPDLFSLGDLYHENTQLRAPLYSHNIVIQHGRTWQNIKFEEIFSLIEVFLNQNLSQQTENLILFQFEN